MEIVSGGGSGTYTVTPFLPGMTEIQAGGAIFCDVTYQNWGVRSPASPLCPDHSDQPPQPATYHLRRRFQVVARRRVVARASGIGTKRVRKVVSSAEHGSLELESPNDTLDVGDLLDFVVGYGDGTVYLHDVMVGVRKGIVQCVWPILGRGKLQ